MPSGLPPLSAADAVFLAAVLALLALARRWMPLYALLLLPGTLLHELSHWLVALLTGGRPGAPGIIPVRNEHGRWRLGSVAIGRVRWFNALPIGLAPLLLAPLAWFALHHAGGSDPARWPHWLALYVAATAAALCLPSPADLRIVASRPFGAVLYVTLGAGATYFWLVR